MKSKNFNEQLMLEASLLRKDDDEDEDTEDSLVSNDDVDDVDEEEEEDEISFENFMDSDPKMKSIIKGMKSEDMIEVIIYIYIYIYIYICIYVLYFI